MVVNNESERLLFLFIKKSYTIKNEIGSFMTTKLNNEIKESTIIETHHH